MNWDARLDEARASAPEAPPHKSRKNTKRWCKGKPGIEHDVEVRLSKRAVRRKSKFPDKPSCSWFHWWRRDGAGNMYPDESSWHWSCSHERGCRRCGKVIDSYLGRGCPDYVPRDVSSS